MRVSMEGNNPDELQAILEALTKAYMADVDDRDNGARRKRLAKLDESYRGTRADLERYRKQEATIALAIGSRYGPTLAQLDALLDADLKLAIQELTTARGERTLAEMAYKDVQASHSGSSAPVGVLPWDPSAETAGPPIPAALIEAQLTRQTVYQQREAAVASARTLLDDTKKLYTERVLAVIQAEEALKNAQDRLAKYRETIRPAIEAELHKQLNEKKAQKLETLQADLAKATNRETFAQQRLALIQKEIERKNDFQGEIEKLRFDITQTEALCVTLATETERLKVELGAPPRVTLAEEPFVLPGIEGKRRLKYTAMAALGVLLAGICCVVGWESRIRRVTHPDDLATSLGVRLLGTVPPTHETVEQEHPIFVEAIDAIRTMLLNGTPHSNLRFLVITSAVSGEGKTSVTGHLAISLARVGFRTLLVDGDLRLPTAERVFNVPLSPGLSEVLSGANPGEAIHATSIPNLSVMTSGQWTCTAQQGLVGPRWHTVAANLKEEFDFVIMDSSPLLLVSDALLLAREADGVIVSVLTGVSQFATVDEAVNRLQRSPGESGWRDCQWCADRCATIRPPVRLCVPNADPRTAAGRTDSRKVGDCR